MRILLGVSGGIAAYKAATLVRCFQRGGHDVRCALTPSAERFVAPLTLEVLTGHRVYSDSYLEANGSGEEQHITAVVWADTFCVAPATANILARLALGLAEDFVSTAALAFQGPFFVAPAMHEAMWKKDSVQENVERLRSRGVQILGPERGALASGEEGWGRMMEPIDIVRAITGDSPALPLHNRRVVVSAGPTHEKLDPVRFLANRSSGKMGFALAREAAARGARVTLVAGPVSLATPPGVERVDVTDARSMQEAVNAASAEADLVIMAAAVSDFRPDQESLQKIKKERGLPAISLVENPDILLGLAEVAPTAVRVGFAAETEDLEANAEAKLARKKVDFLVANDVSRQDIGFGSDHNEVIVYRPDSPCLRLERKPKAEIAAELLELFGGAVETRRPIE